MTSSPEAIQKAKVLLGLIKAEESPDLIKAKKDVDEKEANEKKEKLEKAKADYDDVVKKAKELLDKAEVIKAEAGDEGKMWGTTNGDQGNTMGHQGTVSMKAEDIELIKADITKTFNQKIDATVVLYQEKEQENTELKKVNDDLKKSFDDLNGKFTKIDEAIQKFGKQTTGPRSLIKANQVVDRFAPAQEGERQLSLSRDKQIVIAELIKAAGSDLNPTNIFAKAASTIEICGALGSDANEASAVAQALRKLNGTIIVG